jgi:hypothetical protein
MRFSSVSLVSLATCTALGGFVSTSTQSYAAQNSILSNVQEQHSTITIARKNISGSDIFLKIGGTDNAQIKGVIKVNGKFMANLENTRSLNLTSCLNRSTCEISIDGTYNPDASVKIELYSTNKNMKSTLETSGTGKLKQKMIVNIT